MEVSRNDARKLVMDSGEKVGDKGLKRFRNGESEILLLYGSKLKTVKDKGRKKYMICGYAYDGSDVSKHVRALHDVNEGNTV